MPRLPHHTRRDAIVAAALAVARRKGLGATTARDVAAEMHTSSGLIHHYFASMDDLLSAAFERSAAADLESTNAAVHAADTPLAKLNAFFDNYQRSGEEWAYQLWLDAWSEAARRPALRATSERLNIEWTDCLQGIIVAGVDDGSFRCFNPAATAWRILSLLDGLALQVVAHPHALSHDVVIPWSLRFAESELGLDTDTLQLPAA